VRIGSARPQFFPRIGIELNNVRAGDPARLTLASVGISARLAPLFDRRIEEAEIALSGSRIELPLPFDLPERGANPSPDGAAADDAGVELVSVRAITLRDVVVVSRGKQITVSADSSLAANRLDISRFTAESGRTQLDASGVVALEPRIDAKLTVKANQLDLDELLALAAAFSPPAQPARRAAVASRARPSTAPEQDARVVASLSARSARAGQIEVTELATTLESEGDRVTMSPLSFQLFGGKYEGSIAATLGRVMAATVKSRITNMDVAALAAFGGSPNTVTGRLSATGTFSGQGNDIERALANARGSGTATMVDGTIQRLNLVRTIVLFFGRPAPDSREGSDRYDRMDLRFSLANQIFRADALTFTSPDVDIAGTGTLTLPTKALDGVLTLSLSEELSSQAGTDLVRYTREGNRVTLPARLGGTIESPRVAIDAKAAITRGLRNEGERRLKGLLDDLLK
jgi:uncharacterized protein involved in outer membrane biogenesis